MKILINHIGYEAHSSKTALIECSENEHISKEAQVTLFHEEEELPVGRIDQRSVVPGWKGRFYYKINFSQVRQEGKYRLRLKDGPKVELSPVFKIESGLYADTTISDILCYYKSQRVSWRWDKADHNVGFYGERDDKVDVHGGWYDASGDYSKYLTHLSYANYTNPQQSPLVTWALLDLTTVLGESSKYKGTLLEERALDEALYGADFLVRMLDPEGFFYVSIFDQWSKGTEERLISAFRGKEGIRMENYQAGFRQGAGMTIAALARASRFEESGEFSSVDYINTAVSAWDHLQDHGTEYLDNGKENIIDVYCALMAAVELYKSTDNPVYLEAARKRAGELYELYDWEAGYWLVEKDSNRPYFHAAEAGLPIIALSEYLSIEKSEDKKEHIKNTVTLIRTAVMDILQVTNENPQGNPFLLARQWTKPVDGEVRSSFFFPHNNETGYWWQGENAKLASLSCAARRSEVFFAHTPEIQARLEEFADAQLHWILGRNPYDTCMLQGHGRNNPRYEEHYPNAPGGICNGITGGFEDETDIDFLPESVAGQGDHRWRWSEQWIPHAAWFLLALTADAQRWKL